MRGGETMFVFVKESNAIRFNTEKYDVIYEAD